MGSRQRRTRSLTRSRRASPAKLSQSPGLALDLWEDRQAERNHTGYVGPSESAVHHRHSNSALVKEQPAHVELATVGHREPQSLIKLLIRDFEPQVLDVCAQQNLDSHGNALGQPAGD